MIPTATRAATPFSRTARRVLALAAVLALPLFGALPAAAATGSISGSVFEDTDRDGVRDAGEAPWAARWVNLNTADGRYLRNAKTDAEGRYSFGEVPAGEYLVEYNRSAWYDIWNDWVPTTTGSIRPQVVRSVSGPTLVDFGWRQIRRSTSPSAPMSTYTGGNGLRVESFNDAVTAREVFDAVMAGTLHGGEAPLTTIRFDYGVGDACVSRFTESSGTYSDFGADCRVAYLRWLDSHDAILFHEYGHAWSAYHAYIVQQDGSLTGFLRARGIDPNDPRLGTSHAWNSGEILAEDYRQLFGSVTAQLRPQENAEIPTADAVPGLREYLRDVFTAAPSPQPEPQPTASPSPSPTPTSTPSPAPTAPTKTKGGGGGGSGCKGKNC